MPCKHAFFLPSLPWSSGTQKTEYKPFFAIGSCRITFSLPSASVAVAAAAASCRRPLLLAAVVAAAAAGVVGVAVVVAAAAAVPPKWSCSRLRAWRHCPRRLSRCRDCRCGCAGRGGAAAAGDRGPGIDTRHAIWN